MCLVREQVELSTPIHTKTRSLPVGAMEGLSDAGEDDDQQVDEGAARRGTSTSPAESPPLDITLQASPQKVLPAEGAPLGLCLLTYWRVLQRAHVPLAIACQSAFQACCSLRHVSDINPDLLTSSPMTHLPWLCCLLPCPPHSVRAVVAMLALSACACIVALAIGGD